MQEMECLPQTITTISRTIMKKMNTKQMFSIPLFPVIAPQQPNSPIKKRSPPSTIKPIATGATDRLRGSGVSQEVWKKGSVTERMRLRQYRAQRLGRLEEGRGQDFTNLQSVRSGRYAVGYKYTRTPIAATAPPTMRVRRLMMVNTHCIMVEQHLLPMMTLSVRIRVRRRLTKSV